MKKARLAAESLADRLDLPQDALLGSGKLTVAAGRQVFIENHCGILNTARSAYVLRSTAAGSL